MRIILTKIGDWVNPALEKFESGVKVHQKDVFLIICLVLVSLISYNLGRMGALKKTPITIIEGQDRKADIHSATGAKKTSDKPSVAPVLDKRVVVSKNSDKYHFTWCSGAKRIKEENKIWFADEAAAQAAGYTKAGNCN